MGFVLWAVCLVVPHVVQADGGGVTVVELFTTQLCPSCPPGDRIFEKLVKENRASNVIMLSCHVTYFDREALKDHLAEPFCDARQGAYFSALNSRAMFTPQVVINGKFDIPGNQERVLRKGIAMGRSLNVIQPVQLGLRDGYLDISLPSVRLEGKAAVWLIGYDTLNTVILSAGPNRGQALNYVNAVRHITKLMDWDGGYSNMAFPVESRPADGYAVIVQYDEHKHVDIVAAGKVER